MLHNCLFDFDADSHSVTTPVQISHQESGWADFQINHILLSLKAALEISDVEWSVNFHSASTLILNLEIFVVTVQPSITSREALRAFNNTFATVIAKKNSFIFSFSRSRYLSLTRLLLYGFLRRLNPSAFNVNNFSASKQIFQHFPFGKFVETILFVCFSYILLILPLRCHDGKTFI